MEKQKKLLLVSGDLTTPTVLKYCKEIGVYTIMTNNIPYETNPFKQMADEAWEIDISEVDILEKKCREAGVTNVFAGVNEYNIDIAQTLAKRLGLRFYGSDEGWACARDKIRFKEHCIAVGLDVPKRYYVTEEFDQKILDEIQYPVIIKPVDCAGQSGLSLCYNEEELRSGYLKALAFSSTKRILVEEYITGEEMAIEYHYVNGQYVITTIDAMTKQKINDRQNFIVSPLTDRFYQEYMDKCYDKTCELFRRMDVKDGSYYFQAINSNGKFYFLEFIYRIDGPGLWTIQEPILGYNKIRLMVDIALGRESDLSWATPENLRRDERRGMIYFCWMNPGKIAQISGVEELAAIDGITFIYKRFNIGDIVEKTDNMRQMAFFIGILGKDNADMVEKFKLINEKLSVIDENGNEMFIRYEDYSALRK